MKNHNKSPNVWQITNAVRLSVSVLLLNFDCSELHRFDQVVMCCWCGLVFLFFCSFKQTESVLFFGIFGEHIKKLGQHTHRKLLMFELANQYICGV